VTVLLTLLLAAAAAGAAQEPRMVSVVAGARYASPPGGQVWVLGKNYRELWGTQIRVEVLDLSRVASGLRPVRRVGGEETLGLALAGADGRSYTFRAVDKDLTHVLPDFLRSEAVEDVAQDQLSATVPGVEVVAHPFARAAGVLEPEARLVVMPDDEALGEHREDFAGVLGTFLEYPQPGFDGATEIQDHDSFWERRQNDPWNRADTRAFLRARLLDLFLGDWDRHRGQWRWARVPGNPLLRPLAEDRDQVFCDFEGLAMSAARATGAQLLRFEPDYAALADGTQNGWDLDRFLLTDLDHRQWMEEAGEVQANLTDAVIEEGLRRLPPEYYTLVGADLTKTLRERRDGLAAHAERYYDYLSEKVDVHGSNLGDVAFIHYLSGDEVEVRISLAGEEEPYYARRFHDDETEEIRIYLHGGEDRLLVEGEDEVDVKIHVVGGDGADVVEASKDTDVDYWDPSRSDRVRGDVDVRTKAYTDPGLKRPNETVPWVPSRDFGRFTRPLAAFGFHPDAGLVVGGGIDSTDYGFRKVPWSNRNVLKGAYAFGAKRPLIDYQGDFRRMAADWHLALESRFSGLDQLRYYGLGNETPNERADEVYQISLYQLTLFPALTLSRGAKGRLLAGPIFRYADSTGTHPDTILGEEAPAGFGTYGQLGLQVEGRYDSRFDKDVFDAGYELRLEGAFYPELWDVERHYGYANAELGLHVPLSERLFLSVFTGGRKVWGDAFPFFDAAYIGGHHTTAGYNWNRFAGDASLYGAADLKLVLHQFRKLVPGELGLVFDAGAGRVWLESESSSKWHPSFGLGVFYAPFHRAAVFEAGVGKSVEQTFFIFRAQMKFFEF
jgi:hypothetical protein